MDIFLKLFLFESCEYMNKHENEILKEIACKII